MSGNRMYVVLFKEKDSDILQFAASYNAKGTLDAASILAKMFIKYETYTKQEMKKAKIVHDDDGGSIHIGGCEYYLITDEFIKKAPQNVQQIYINLMKQTAENELPC